MKLMELLLKEFGSDFKMTKGDNAPLSLNLYHSGILMCNCTWSYDKSNNKYTIKIIEYKNLNQKIEKTIYIKNEDNKIDSQFLKNYGVGNTLDSDEFAFLIQTIKNIIQYKLEKVY